MLTVLQGDALTMLRTLESESVQCCVTSPPYWGLRDYGLEPITWDETVECEHGFAAEEIRYQRGKTGDKVNLQGGSQRGEGGESQQSIRTGSFCSCGAWRGSLGLEPTPELYIQHVVQIFRELKRVLRKDGTAWLNLGDSYASSAGGYDADGSVGTTSDGRISLKTRAATVAHRGRKPPIGLKPKDLCMIPARVALALQADGWWLRSDIVWSKPNPMPESVTDRPTRSHEYLFLLTKSARYYYDADAIREPHTEISIARADYENRRQSNNGHKSQALRPTKPMNEVKLNPDGRNARSVWIIPTMPFRDAHFATFPPKLAKRCVLAGSKHGDVILDPFAGSGTVGEVSIQLGRRVVLIEPNPKYIPMINRRCTQTIGLALTG